MRSVVFCCSQRYKKEVREFIKELKEIAESKGIFIQVFEPDFEKRSEKFLKSEEKDRLKSRSYRKDMPGLVMAHLYVRVARADVCFIFNKDGYIGTNTTLELGFAAGRNKIIYSIENLFATGEDRHIEPCCRVVINEVVSTPEELFRRLL